jgi:hypothetical protein
MCSRVRSFRISGLSAFLLMDLSRLMSTLMFPSSQAGSEGKEVALLNVKGRKEVKCALICR